MEEWQNETIAYTKKERQKRDGKSTHQAYCKGCSGAFICKPGVFGSSIIGGSGGFAVPSILSALVFTNLAVIASKLGIFLYPTFFCLSGGCVGACEEVEIPGGPFAGDTASLPLLSKFNFSNFSAVNASPPSTSVGVPSVESFEGVTELVGVEPGEAARVVDGFTAIESAEATVDTDVEDPVRKANAASLGLAEELLLVTVAFASALLPILAAS